MIMTPVTIYINVNVIFVESHNKADKGDYNIKHSSTGEIVLLVMIVVYIYNIFLNSCIYLQHFTEKLYDSTTFEVNRVVYNPILVYLHTGISVMLVIIYSI